MSLITRCKITATHKKAADFLRLFGAMLAVNISLFMVSATLSLYWMAYRVGASLPHVIGSLFADRARCKIATTNVLGRPCHVADVWTPPH